VIHHGAERWSGARTLHDLLGVPAPLAPFVPGFEAWVCDLSHMPDEEIRGALVLRIGLEVLRSIFRDDLRDRLPGLVRMLGGLDSDPTGELMAKVLRYLSKATDRVSRDDLVAAVRQTLPEEKGRIMPTIAETWIEEGREKGRAEGVQEGLRRAVCANVEGRFGTVPPDVAAAIASVADVTRLEDLLRASLRVNDLLELRRLLSPDD
jgi:hypothetical protein